MLDYRDVPRTERCGSSSDKSITSPELNWTSCIVIFSFNSDVPLPSELRLLGQLGTRSGPGEDSGLLDSLKEPELGVEGNRFGLLSITDEAVEGLDGLREIRFAGRGTRGTGDNTS
jgi:hypothetical protein